MKPKLMKYFPFSQRVSRLRKRISLALIFCFLLEGFGPLAQGSEDTAKMADLVACRERLEEFYKKSEEQKTQETQALIDALQERKAKLQLIDTQAVSDLVYFSYRDTTTFL